MTTAPLALEHMIPTHRVVVGPCPFSGVALHEIKGKREWERGLESCKAGRCGRSRSQQDEVSEDFGAGKEMGPQPRGGNREFLSNEQQSWREGIGS